MPAPTTPFPAFVARGARHSASRGHVREPGIRFRLSVQRIEVPKTNDRAADRARRDVQFDAGL